MGVSRPVVSETESGKTYPSPATLAKLAKYFGVSEMFLEYGKVGGGPLDQVAVDQELPASELLKQKAPATRASAKKR